MKNLGLIISIGLVVVNSSCTPVDPSFDTEQQFRHVLLDEEKCTQLSQQSVVEVNCWETITFRADGQADVLLGGGDVMIRSSYKRKSRFITVNETAGLPKKLVFKIVEDRELIRTDTGDKWQRF